jgi:uncharacterized protein (TIGR03083 family)
MTSLADRTIDALRVGHDDLVAFVTKLESDDITRVSGASEWTVAQVLSHLGSGAEINLAALDAALDGRPNPGQEFNQTAWARWDAMSPAEQAANFSAANERFVARCEGLDDLARTELRIDLGFLPQPVDVATAAGMRLHEFAMHSWDVRVAFDPTATVAADAAEVLLTLAGPLVGFVGKGDQIDGTVRLAVHTLDPVTSFGIVIGDAVAMTDVPDPADGELTAPAEYVLRMFNGRGGAAHTPDSVVLTGAVTLADLRRVFPGY